MNNFYSIILKKLISAGSIDSSLKTLVVAAGSFDHSTLLDAGFTDVTISNLDTRISSNEFAPFHWSYQDAEALDYEDGSFEQVIEHAGLHHCASPHRALTEMYRVASRSVLVFEARDSMLMRFGKVFGLTSDYEVEAVVANGYEYGGWRNTALPNYVYRWTEREVKKTIASYDPRGSAGIKFFYGLRLPTERLAMGVVFKRIAVTVLAFPIRLMFNLARRQGNEFAFFIDKPKSVHPWINADLSPNRLWLDRRYRAKISAK